MNTLTSVGIIGNGAIGSALGKLLAESGLEVDYCDQDAQKCTVGTVADLVRLHNVIFICTPTAVLRSVAQSIADDLKAESEPRLVVALSKGVEPKFVTAVQILESESHGGYDFGVLYGPMIASELNAGHRGGAVLATSQQWDVSALQATRLKVELSSDPKSVAYCGVFKNIYAFAHGVSDGLSLGGNFKAMLTTYSLLEIDKVMAELEADHLVWEGLAGIGDLLGTAYSSASTNYQAGVAFANGQTDVGGEGYHSLQQLNHVVKTENYPILNCLVGMVTKGLPPASLEAAVAKA
ncbi:hypothetical protein HY346_02055 [Candidatus Microgenomates bacterium]|nr:hypothetical protein [Candidatus Microgenomates bacterium]